MHCSKTSKKKRIFAFRAASSLLIPFEPKRLASYSVYYRLDLEIREHVRMLLSIAFLLVSDVSTAFETIQKTCPETAHPIFNHFENNYVGRLSVANGTRQNPRFDLDSWSCHQRVITGRPRTNNDVEGWNSNFVKLVNGKHPSFPKLKEKFQDEQKNAGILIKKTVCRAKSVNL